MDVFDDLNYSIMKDDIKGVEQCIMQHSLSHDIYVEVCRKFSSEPVTFRPLISRPRSVVVRDYPTIVAAKHGRLDIFKKLVEFKFDHNMTSMVNTRMYRRGQAKCPIEFACRGGGHLAVVKYLIEELEVSVKNDSATSLFHCAIGGNHLQIVKYLVKQGAPLNGSDSVMHQTPLHSAVFGDSEDIVSVLVQEGADLNAVDKYDATPLFYAAGVRGNIKIVQTLVEADLNPYPAVRVKQRLDVMRHLCSKGADREHIGNRSTGSDTLIHAILSEQYEIVRYMVVELNIPVNRAKGPVPLDEAVGMCRPSIVSLLLDCEVSCRPPWFEFKFSSWVSADKRCYILDLFNRRVETPPTLAQLCCFGIRRTFGRHLSNVGDSLPVPRKVIDFIKLNHIPLTPDGIS